jgi:hypothetical protein
MNHLRLTSKVLVIARFLARSALIGPARGAGHRDGACIAAAFHSVVLSDLYDLSSLSTVTSMADSDPGHRKARAIRVSQRRHNKLLRVPSTGNSRLRLSGLPVPGPGFSMKQKQIVENSEARDSRRD